MYSTSWFSIFVKTNSRHKKYLSHKKVCIKSVFCSLFFGDFSIRLHTILFAEKRQCLSFKQRKFTIFNLGYFKPPFFVKKRCPEILTLELKYSQKLLLINIFIFTDIPFFNFLSSIKMALSNITLCSLSWHLY